MYLGGYVKRLSSISVCFFIIYVFIYLSRLTIYGHIYLHEKKVVLLWTPLHWFGDYTKLQDQGCPSWQCEFTTDRSKLQESAAVVFKSSEFHSAQKHYHNQSQMWVWLDVEAPTEPIAVSNVKDLMKYKLSKQVNWTMTYHRNADISIGYGGFFVPSQKFRPLRPHLMSSHHKTMEVYMEARANGITLEEVMGSQWKSFVERPRLVAWMSSHCTTNSRREEYVAKLQQFVKVDTYGRCGKKRCWKREPINTICWERVMRPNYLFYMAMENNLCEDYATEKLYQPLDHGIVPIVYGGANYSDILPPGSFIDARKYHPKELANILIELKKDPLKYGSYHIWRKFWKTEHIGTMCELCHKLHQEITPKYYQDIESFRNKNGRCFNPPSKLFKNEEWGRNISNKLSHL